MLLYDSMQLVKTETPVTPTAVPFKQKSVRGKLWVILPWTVFGLACVLLGVGLIVSYPAQLDSDMASELVLAKMLAEGKGFILTNQWFYSTEIRFLNTQLIFVPLFWLFKSWAVVRIVGTIILHGLMLASFYFLLASLQKKALFPWTATFLLLATSWDWAHFVNHGAFYLPHVTIAFAILGLVFYAVRTTNTQHRNWLIVGATVLSLLAGIGGFRQIVITSIPLVLASVMFWLTSRQPTTKTVAVKMVVTSSIALAGALCGLVVNIILGHWFSFVQFLGVTWRVPSLDSLWTVLTSLLAALGWREGKIIGGGGQLLATC